MRKTILAAVAAGLAGAPALAVPADFKARADAVMAAFPADGPGAVAVVYEKGRPVYAAGRGLADIATKAPLTPDTPLRLGSITKTFTAAVIMQLVDEGKVRLDDPLSKYLPDFPKPGADATVRQLLNHTSGVASYTNIPMAMLTMGQKSQTTSAMIASFKDAPPTHPAGSEWAYSNSGYVLLGAIIEQVTGKPWHVAVDERIARPLGLKSLRYGGAADGEKGMAAGYMLANGKAAPALPLNMSFPHAAGSLVANAGDVATFLRALSGGRLVKPASYRAMTAKTTLLDGRTVPYGLGMSVDDVRGRPSVGHNGGINGFTSNSLLLPGEDLAVVVLANSDNPVATPETISRKLAAAALGQPYEEFTAIPLDLKAVTPLLGIYKGGEVERRFLARDGKLYTVRNGGSPMEVAPAAGRRFFYPGSLSWFAIAAGADGKPVMRFHANGDTEAAQLAYAGPNPAEAPTVSVPRAELDRLTGTYQGPMPIVVAVDGEGVLTLKFGPQPVTHLLPESATAFRVKEIDARVSFQLDGGKVSGLIIHQGGRDLPAKRTN